MGRRVKDDDITKGRKMRSLVAVMLACLGCLVLAVSGRADAPESNAPHTNAAPFLRPVTTYYLHRVKIEETSPAEYLWVISNDQQESVAAKSLSSPKLRDWVTHRPGSARIYWPRPFFGGILSDVLAQALLARMKRDKAFRTDVQPPDADRDKAPEEGVAEFEKFCESNHVEFDKPRSQF